MSLRSLALKLSVPVFLAAVTATSGAFAAGPYDHRGPHRDVTVGVFVNKAPPPVRYERVPPPPRYGRPVAWNPGYWDHRHGRYVWVKGAYRPAPHAHAHWNAPRWEHRPQGWVFIGGSWR